MTSLDDRRQSAREAAHDAATGNTSQYYRDRAALAAAIEAATRVKITPEVIDAFIRSPEDYEHGDVANPLRAAFRAAGFEVVE
jgi:hypothetical protein